MVFVVSQLPLSSEISQFCSSGACPSPLLLPSGREPHVRSYVVSRFQILNFGQLGEIQNHTWSALTDSSCLLLKNITIVYRFMITRCRPCTGGVPPARAALQPCSQQIHVRSYVDLLFHFLNLLIFRKSEKHTRSRLRNFLPVVRKNYQYCLFYHAY